MNTLDFLLIFICTIISAVSLSLGYRFVKTRQRVGTLTATSADFRDVSPSADRSGTHAGADITVVIPARNEVRDIAATVHSLLNQRNVSVQIVVVDDYSTDGTGELLDRLAQETPQLRVLHAMPMRPGWFGKANAMQHGLELFDQSELVLFTDADICFAPGCLEAAWEEFKRKELDFLSLLPRFDATTFWENVYMPHSFIAGCVRFLPSGVNEQHRPEGAAAGAFMLTRREALRQVGDLSGVKQEMLDDISLACCFKRYGYRAEIRFAPDLLSVEMFKDNTHAFWGTTKNILAAVDQMWKAVPVMFLPLLVYWTPIFTAVLGVLTSQWWLVAVGMATYLIQAATLRLVLPIARLKWPHALCFPLAVLPVMCSMSVAIYHRVVHRGVLWRGRVLSVDR